MLKKILVILCFGALLPAGSQASWEQVGSHFAGRANGIAIGYEDTTHTDHNIYATDSSYRVYTSSNMGVLWYERDTNTTHATCIITPPENSQLAYVGRYELGVWKTEDGGEIWNFTSLMRYNLQIVFMSFTPTYTDSIWAACDTLRVLYFCKPWYQLTVDAGSTWCPCPPEVDDRNGRTCYGVSDMVINNSSSDTLYVALQSTAEQLELGVYKTQIDEATCPIRDCDVDETPTALRGDARSVEGRVDSATLILYAGVHTSVESLASMGVWKTVGTDSDWVFLEGTGYPITAIAIDPSSNEDTVSTNDTLYVGTEGYGILRSTNGGTNWSFVNDGIYCRNILYIAPDPIKDSIVYAGGEWSFYVSTNYGETWTERIQGMKKAQISGVGSNAPTKYCLGEFDNLYKSTDEGSSWTTIYAFEGKPGFEGSDRIKAKLITVNKDNHNKLFATVFVPSSEGGYNSDRILRSTDGGSSWQVVFDPNDSGLVATSLVIDPEDSNTVYATYDGPIYTKIVMKSTSGGDSATWSPKVSGLPNDGVLCLAVAVDPGHNNILYVGTKANGVYKNMGGGDSSWAQIGLSGKKVRTIAINPGNANQIFAGCSTGVYRSTDGGTNWSLVDNGMISKNVYSIVVELDDCPEIYAACLGADSNGHIYISPNSGGIWTEVNYGLPSDWVVLADDVPYITLQTDSLASGNHVFLGTKKGFFKRQMPSYLSGDIVQDTTWGPGGVYIDGDVTVDSSITLTVDSNTIVVFKPNFDGESGGADTQKCELTVFGTLNAKGAMNDSTRFLSAAPAPSDSDWHGITVTSSGSAQLDYCDLGHAYTAIYFDSSTHHDTVTHCRFSNHFMHAIKTENSTLFIDSCRIENDSIDGNDETTYGILCYLSSPTIKNSLIKDCKYGIKAHGSIWISANPLIEECGFYNIGEAGVWGTPQADFTLRQSCFKGDYGKTCVHVMGNPMIRKCYMASEGNGILIGMLFSGSGNVRRTTIWDYDSCAVQIVGRSSRPDFGTSDSAGNNWFELRTNHYYFISSSFYTIDAESSYWDTEDFTAIDTMIYGDVDFWPVLEYCSPPSPYYPDICSDLPPGDPSISPCKIAACNEEKTPKSFSLSQNFPNPFNPQTVIKYDLPEPAQVSIIIYNILGQKVRTLVDENQQAGYKSVSWDGKDDQGKDIASGIYFYKIEAGDFSTVKKMVLLK